MVAGNDSMFKVLKSSSKAALNGFKVLLENQSTKLRQVRALRIRRSPKRRAISIESESSRSVVASSILALNSNMCETDTRTDGRR